MVNIRILYDLGKSKVQVVKYTTNGINNIYIYSTIIFIYYTVSYTLLKKV